MLWLALQQTERKEYCVNCCESLHAISHRSGTHSPQEQCYSFTAHGSITITILSAAIRSSASTMTYDLILYCLLIISIRNVTSRHNSTPFPPNDNPSVTADLQAFQAFNNNRRLREHQLARLPSTHPHLDRGLGFGNVTKRSPSSAMNSNDDHRQVL
jgi:hypothetical protein